MFPKSSVPRTLLEYFRVHSGRVLTREELALHVWNFRLDHRSRVIDQTVNMVRKQLGPPEQIVTVHGEGYRHQRDEQR
jgi:two-component system OmpR family response regulator